MKNNKFLELETEFSDKNFVWFVKWYLSNSAPLPWKTSKYLQIPHWPKLSYCHSSDTLSNAVSLAAVSCTIFPYMKIILRLFQHLIRFILSSSDHRPLHKKIIFQQDKNS